MKKLISLALALALCLGLCVPVLAADFSDVPASHSFYSAIMDCAGKGIVGGYSDGTFQPGKTVTRSNFAVMLSRAFYAAEVAANQIPLYTEKGTFYPNFMALKNNGILDGTSWVKAIDSAKVMNQGINRFDMATLMTNIMKQKGFAASDSEKSSAIPKITDYNSIWYGYQDAVANVYALGIITGYADGSFNGDGIMNRGQACVVIYRMMQYAGNTSGGEVVTPVPEVPTAPETGNTEATTPSTLTLRDGSAVTEENVLNRIQEILKVFPNGAPWSERTAGLNKGLRDNSVSINGYELGTPSKAVMQIQTNHYTSMTSGCGGFAGLVSDAIFGGANNGGENFPIRKLDSVAQVRPGDILVEIGADGVTDHVLTAAARVMSTKERDGITIYAIAVYDGNSNDSVRYNDYGDCYFTDELYRDHYSVAYTRYPA